MASLTTVTTSSSTGDSLLKEFQKIESTIKNGISNSEDFDKACKTLKGYSSEKIAVFVYSIQEDLEQRIANLGSMTAGNFVEISTCTRKLEALTTLRNTLHIPEKPLPETGTTSQIKKEDSFLTPESVRIEHAIEQGIRHPDFYDETVSLLKEKVQESPSGKALIKKYLINAYTEIRD